MKHLAPKWVISAAALLVLILLHPAILTRAQNGDTGSITVTACYDQNADGDCTDRFDGPAPPATVACLDTVANCLPVPATFPSLPPGSYTTFLQFPGVSTGHYPTTPRPTIELNAGDAVAVTLGAVYPIHPKDIAVHVQLNKVYAVFQGPTINGIRPFPFVAVIDGDTDEVLRTIPGGENGFVPGAPNGAGVGRDAWGVEVSANGEFVYVGAFNDGIITIIDPDTDVALTSISPGVPFKPIAPAVSPVSGRVHFTDYDGGRMLVLNDDPPTFPTNPLPERPNVVDFPNAFSPFEITIANTPFGGYNYITLRDAFAPNKYKFVGLRSEVPFNLTYHDIALPGDQTGMPHAISLWQQAGRPEARLFFTIADDPRPAGNPFPNPNRLALYGFDPGNPDVVSLRTSSTFLGNYAEVGLDYNPDANHMLGTYAGFPYLEELGEVAACNNPARGGTYALTFNGNRLGVADGAATPDVWKYPEKVIGNPPTVADGMRWRNPFELAINPNTGKIYVTDRCWNEFAEGGIPGGGAVLIFHDTGTPDTPTGSTPALSVTKSDQRDPVIAGFPLIYTIRVTNTGDVNLTVDVVDHLPPGVTANSPTTFRDIFIPFGGVWQGVITTTVNPDTLGLLTNRVEATSREGATGEAIEETLVVESAILVRKTDSVDPVIAGSVMTYTIQVENVGDIDLLATVVDVLPPEVIALGDTQWRNIIMRANSANTIHIPVRVRPEAAGPLLNRVFVTTAEGPEATTEETTQVANMRVSKSAAPEPVAAGQALTYTIRVDNLGSVPLNANIVDAVPADVIYNGPTTWQPVIPVGGFWQETFVVTVDPGAFLPLTNTVRVTTREGITGTATVTSTVAGRGVITIKSCLDIDADGVCSDPNSLPPGVLGCLRASSGASLGCQPIGPAGAVFSNLVSTLSYTPSLQFTGEAQGFYPTTRPRGYTVNSGEQREILLGAVYPIHPKGIAVHGGSNKVYVAVQGPKMGDAFPYPFVAVLNGDTDEALYTIPGGAGGIGRQPWGVVAAGRYVYVGSFEEGFVSVIDTTADQVVATPAPAGTFTPAAAVANPANGRVIFADYRGGRVIALDGTAIVDGAYVHNTGQGFSPFEIAVAGAGAQGTSFVTLREALPPYPYKLAALDNASRQLSHIPLTRPDSSSGNPHAVAVWEQGGQGRVFVTYAADPRPTNTAFPNPDMLAVYGFSAANPRSLTPLTADIPLPGGFVEAGLTLDAANNRLIGLAGGFGYTTAGGDAAACDSAQQGGAFQVDFNGTVSGSFAPALAVGNPPVAMPGFSFKNPFEVAVNPATGKIYVTDRCWNQYPGLPAIERRGAVLVAEGGVVGGAGAPAVTGQRVVNPAAGDINGDGRVDIADLSFVASRYGLPDPAADLNGDGVVDMQDIAVIATNYGK
ncbi:MAG: hypothetical protein Kow0031_13850 [Anaerolineae bacterium]